jgi:predicted RNA-binding protein YlxR (DUF448 family)
LEQGKFILSQRGNAMLLDKFGYAYKTDRKNKTGKIYWICCECNKINDKKIKIETKKYFARAVTDGIYVKQWNGEHNHPLNEKMLLNPK